MSEPSDVAPAGDKRRRIGPGMWIALAALLVVAPAVAGFALLNDDGGTGDDPSGEDMSAGVMSDTSPTTTGRDLAALIDSGDMRVRDLEEILAGDVVVEVAPGGDTAEVRLQTTVDAVCAVAYGATEDLGSLATDTDMAGGGHSDHHPVLRGLEPGTEYRYRMLAITGDGSLYASEVMTFRAVASDDPAAREPPAPNIAVGASIEAVSSEYSDAFAAANAIDGNGLSEWSSAGDGDDAFIELDFGEPIEAVGVGFHTREMTDGTSITTSFTITVDDDRTYGPFAAGPGLSIAEVSFVGRWVRFDVETSTGGNTGAVEVEVYGTTVAEAAEGM